MLNFSQKAFTLVELLIVVVILTILTTIGFISYEDYLVDARDSKRIAHLTWLRDAMRLTSTKKSLPLPDSSIEIRNNGVWFLYQWYAGKTVLDSVGFSETTQDPFDKVFYTYLVSENKKDFQLLGFLEKYNPDLLISSVSQSYAVNYTNRYINTVGKKLGVLVQQLTNTPLQELSPYTASGYIDLATDTTWKSFDAYVTDTYIISGTGASLTGIIPFTTCKKILQLGYTHGDWLYTINPSWINPFDAYCSMQSDITNAGGWTLIARSKLWSTWNFWWFEQTWDIKDDDYPYSMWPEVLNIPFNEILITWYDTWKIPAKFSFLLKDVSDELLEVNKDSLTYFQKVRCDTLLISSSGDTCSSNYIWWKFPQTDKYYLTWKDINNQGLTTNTFSHSSLYLRTIPGMIFVR